MTFRGSCVGGARRAERDAQLELVGVHQRGPQEGRFFDHGVCMTPAVLDFSPSSSRKKAILTE
jgi:hypothetical protein